MLKSFLIGAIGYPLLELAWRRHTHPSMALAGGLSTMLIHRINRTRLHSVSKALFCGMGITLVEAGCGLVWNRRQQVWDYRRMPLNWRGQICLPYTLIWCLFSLLYMQGEKVVQHYRSR